MKSVLTDLQYTVFLLYYNYTPHSGSPVKEFSLRNIFNELNGVGFSASNWNKLGLQLEVPQNQLDIFE